MSHGPSDVVASGTVTVRSLETGDEWDEMVEVFEKDLERETGPEDVARRVAVDQAGPEPVETLEVDVA